MNNKKYLILTIFIVVLFALFTDCYSLIKNCTNKCAKSLTKRSLSSSCLMNCRFCSIVFEKRLLLFYNLNAEFADDADEITELKISDEKLGMILNKINIDLEQINSLANNRDNFQTDFFDLANFTYQVIKDSIESLTNDISEKDKNLIRKDIQQLNTNVEIIKKDLNKKFSLLYGKLTNETGMLEKSSFIFDRKNNDSYELSIEIKEILKNLTNRLNNIESNMENFTKDFRNYSTSLNEFEKRLSVLENFTIFNPMISKNKIINESDDISNENYSSTELISQIHNLSNIINHISLKLKFIESKFNVIDKISLMDSTDSKKLMTKKLNLKCHMLAHYRNLAKKLYKKHKIDAINKIKLLTNILNETNTITSNSTEYKNLTVNLDEPLAQINQAISNSTTNSIIIRNSILTIKKDDLNRIQYKYKFEAYKKLKYKTIRFDFMRMILVNSLMKYQNLASIKNKLSITNYQQSSSNYTNIDQLVNNDQNTTQISLNNEFSAINSMLKFEKILDLRKANKTKSLYSYFRRFSQKKSQKICILNIVDNGIPVSHVEVKIKINKHLKSALIKYLYKILLMKNIQESKTCKDKKKIAKTFQLEEMVHLKDTFLKKQPLDLKNKTKRFSFKQFIPIKHYCLVNKIRKNKTPNNKNFSPTKLTNKTISSNTTTSMTIQFNQTSTYKIDSNQLNSSKSSDKSEPIIIKPAECNSKIQSDCYDYYKQGYIRNGNLGIRPKTSPTCNKIKVSCDMKSGGYTIIMRRANGEEVFYRKWTDYKIGFGDSAKEHWIGNDMIHYLTTQANYSLRIDMEDWTGAKKYALYEIFQVKSESDGYELVVSGYTGNAGDSLSVHNGKKFSTFDVDNDDAPIEFWKGNCAERFYGAWWYRSCYRSNLNGKYYNGGQVEAKKNDGVAWNSWHGHKYSLKFVEMKIRKNFKK